jgi:CheY-like chemotaxis protein
MPDFGPDRRPRLAGSRLQSFQELSPYRVQDILLVSTLYDSFILAEDGRLGEAILDEFLRLDLRHTPGLTRVSTGAEAVALARAEPRHNLILASIQVADMTAAELARAVRAAGLTVPVVALAYDARDVAHAAATGEIAEVDRVFLWQGDARILLAIVMYIEDKQNVAVDTGQMGVQAILLIEDSVRFYSSYLPVIYTELLRHSHSLAPEGVNLAHKLMRIKARPKILLCGTYEEAWRAFEQYETNILGVISDIEFPRDGRLAPDAGVEFARAVRARQPDVPIMLQSGRPEAEALARDVGASFLLKGSPTLLHQLRRFMSEYFGFGDFVFRRPDGTVVAHAKDLKSLEELLQVVPADSIAYHASRNHFSNWLKARTEFALAHHLRPRKVSDFPSVEHLRQELIGAIQEYRRQQVRSTVVDFDPASVDPTIGLSRIGGGSIGGKARGLAFVNFLLADHDVSRRFPGVQVVVPPGVVLGSEVFDVFLEANNLRDLALGGEDEAAVMARFLAGGFLPEVRAALAAFLERATYPLAVRSSSLLEDSQYQPFAGIYDTWMLPNDHPSLERRLQDLLDAIRRVYASTFSRRAKAYLAGSPYRLEEEKMAVIIQRIVGARHGERFYPEVAGVARSHNFYPFGPLQTADGIAAVALGLGEAVVAGDLCVRFCPRYPQYQVPVASARDLLQNSQRRFYALPLGGGRAGERRPFALETYGLDAAEADGTLAAVGSTYSPENDVLYDGISRPGVRVVTCAPILKDRVFPLAELLVQLLDIGTEATGAPVEIEFAVNLSTPPGAPREFGFLQLRPVALSRELTDLDLGRVDPAAVLCRSTAVLGHGKLDELRDVVVVDAGRFERARSYEVARAVARMNARLREEGVGYLLIGVGRWGSSEPLLGIPVGWDEIQQARVIVEAGFREARVTPSQGTHFFQNLVASSVGYFTVNPEAGEGFVDWEWLAAQPARLEDSGVRHLRFRDPLVVKMNGKKHEGVILKPGADGGTRA